MSIISISALVIAATATDSLPPLLSAPKNIDTVTVVAWTDPHLYQLSDRQQQSPQGDLGVVLNDRGIVINRNGATGMTASGGIAGAGADHLVFTWNGIPLNAPGAGTADISRIPLFFFDGLHTGWQSAGNTIELSAHRPNRDVIEITSVYESLHNQWTGGKVAGTFGKYTYDTRGFVQYAANRFSYRDELQLERPMVVQEHNDAMARGIMHRGLLSLGKYSALTFDGWAQQNRVSIPGQMGTDIPSEAAYADQLGRGMVGWQRRGKRFKQQWIAGMFADRWQYSTSGFTGSDGATDLSEMRTAQYFGRGNFSYVHHQWEHKVFVEPARVEVNTNNYDSDSLALNRLRCGAEVNRSIDNHTTGLRFWNESRNQQNAPVFGWHHKFIRTGYDHRLVWSNVVTLLKRLPDFNELYWQPGGNPSLRPERTTTASTDLRIDHDLPDGGAIEISLTGTGRWGTDWIQWIPSDGQVWQPRNMRQMHSLQSNLSFNYRSGNYWKMEVGLAWTFTSAQIKSDVKTADWTQAWYMPNHMIRAHASVQHGHWKGCMRINYSDKRYFDYYHQLPSYVLVDVDMSYELKHGRFDCSIFGGVSNVTQTWYQSVRGYAMPGRVFSTGIRLTINPKNKYEKQKNAVGDDLRNSGDDIMR
ncbi:MAG: hypothetical protein JNM00_15335 [Flavobacteriales bacterium]|nr:hypothetical protein [Flavobacteriales bacterium]